MSNEYGIKIGIPEVGLVKNKKTIVFLSTDSSCTGLDLHYCDGTSGFGTFQMM